MRLRRSRLVWLLLAIAFLFLLVAVATGAIYFVLRQRHGAASGQDSIAAIEPERIASELALYPLAGAAELETVDAAIVNGQLDTALATLTYSLDLSDAQRIGRLIRLGRLFAEAGDRDRATQSYQQLYDVAVLSPQLNDPARADALLASGKGWATLGEKGQALANYDQVYLVALRSPYLQMAHRRDLLGALEAAYGATGYEDQALACRQRIIELDQQTRPQPPTEPLPSPNLPTGEGVVSSPAIGAAEEVRRQAAYALLSTMQEGVEPPAGLVDELAQALLAEDATKLDFYVQELAATSQLSRRINVHWQVIRWLILKYKVAARGFGLSLVPDWEAQLPDIQSALSKAYEDLFFDYEDLIAGMPQASLMGPGSYQVRRAVVLAGRLGHYPNYPEPQLAEKLRDAVSSLIDAGHTDQLYADTVAEGESIRFVLSPAEQYGLGNGSQSGQSP